MPRMRTIGVGTLLVLLVGCTKPGAEYLGKWQNTRRAVDVFEIMRNGDSFLLKRLDRDFMSGKQREERIPATLKDGVLHIEIDLGSASIAYIKGTDVLTSRLGEFRRVTADHPATPVSSPERRPKANGTSW
jgi:hypothetical protein